MNRAPALSSARSRLALSRSVFASAGSVVLSAAGPLEIAARYAGFDSQAAIEAALARLEELLSLL